MWMTAIYLYSSPCPTKLAGQYATCMPTSISGKGASRLRGSLALKKCSWSLLSYHHQGNRWLPHSSDSTPADLVVAGSTGLPIPIRRYSPAEGSEVVGVTQSLIGLASPLLTALQQKLEKWLVALRSNFLPRHLLWTTVHRVLWPSFRYPLSVSSLSPAQAASTVTKLYQVLLPKLGVNRHYPLPLRYALPHFHGLGLPNPYWEQGISGVLLFLKHANSKSTEATLIRASSEFLHLELGSCLSAFSLPYDSWHFLATDCWLKTLWAFLDSAQLQLHSEEPLIPLPPRLHDGSIMADALLAGLPCPSIEAINRCQIAHQALYWSDVANGWGNSISPAMLRPPTSGRHSSWTWPPAIPSRSDWVIWTAFLKDSLHTASGYFIMPLGPWIHSTHRLDFVPFHSITQSAYVQGQGQFW